ncbi:MAG: N-acetylmuramoyl-L-alanine amidase family protein [Cellulosilyticaceae bacterium]
MKICLDYGHGGKDSGAVFGSRKESQEVLRLGQQIANKLRAQRIQVVETRTTDVYVALNKRIAYANSQQADYFLSIHRNSCAPIGPKGVEVFTANKCSQQATKLAKTLQQALVRMGFHDRGVKKMNFYVLTQTKMPAILVEVGFINQAIDNFLFDTYEEEIAKQIVNGILESIKS